MSVCWTLMCEILVSKMFVCAMPYVLVPVVLQWDVMFLDDCVPDVFVMGAFRGSLYNSRAPHEDFWVILEMFIYPWMLHEYGKYALIPSRRTLDHERFLKTDIQLIRTNLTSRMELGSTLFKTKENLLEPYALHACSHKNENWEKICVNET